MANTTQQIMDMHQLMRGFNAMQAQAGLMPNTGYQQVQQVNPQQHQYQQVQTHPSQTSDRLRVQYLQNMQMNAVTPVPQMGSMTPVRRQTQLEQAFNIVPPDLPSARFGSGAMMARQRAISSTNEDIAMSQAGLGLGFRMGGGTAAMMGGAAMGGPMFGPMGAAAGPLAYEHFGVGQRLQDFGSSMMTPIVAQRQRMLQMQNMSTGFVTRGGDLSASGMGLSAVASQRLSSGLMNMADSRGFQAETGGAFNRQDVMKITSLAGEMGMLDQSQSADQIKTSVRKISKGLKNFMDIMENPDLQEAMQMMGRLRDLGMSVPQTQTAAVNARMFARMAGTSVEGVMQAGMSGAALYQSHGLSGASGLGMGMAAQGAAGIAGTTLDPRTLSLLGGKEGVAQAFQESGVRAATLDPLLPALLKRGEGGSLSVDQGQLSRMMSGEISMQEAVRMSAQNMQRFGAKGIQELSTRKTELQDQIQASLSPEEQMMFPMMQAHMLMKDMPGLDAGGAFRMLAQQGIMGEKQARTLEIMTKTPEFWNTLQQQQERRRREEDRRTNQELERTRELAEESVPGRVIRGFRDSIGRRAGEAFDRIGEHFAEQQDLDEAIGEAGGDFVRAYQADELGSDQQNEAYRRRAKQDGRGTLVRAGRAQQRLNHRIERETQSPLQGTPLVGSLVREVHGPRGFGLSQAGRGGLHADKLLDRQDERGLLSRVLNPRDAAQAEEELRQRADFGAAAEEGGAATVGRQRELDKQVQETAGLDEKQLGTAKIEAADVIENYIKGKKSFFGGMGALDPQEMKEAVIKDLRKKGYPEEKLNKLRDNAAFWKTTMANVSKSRDPDVQAGIAKLKQQGGESRAFIEGRNMDLARKDAQEHREGALDALGIKTGFLSGVSKAEQTAVIDALAGKGDEDDEIRQALIAAEALRAAGEGKRASAIEAEALKGVDAEKAESLTKEAKENAARMGDTALTQMGNKLNTAKSNEDLLSGLNIISGHAGQAKDAETAVQSEKLFGTEAWSAISEGGTAEEQEAALKKFVDEHGADAIKDPEIRKLVEEGKMGEALERAGQKAAGIAAGTERGSGVEAFRSALGDGDISGAFGVLKDAFLGGDEAPGDKKKPATPKTFEEAVPLFSEASSKLLKAAESFEGGSSTSALGNVVGSAASAASGLNPLTGIFNLFRS
jgi:hypothetical protein